MGIVTVRCPATGQDVPTGVVKDLERYERAKIGPNAFACDACGETHIWEKSEGTVQLDGVPFEIP